jgi:hypothetical protein
MKVVGRIKGANDFIDSMEQDTSRNTSLTCINLNQVAKIINVNIGVTQGKHVGLATGNGSRRQGAGIRGTATVEVGHARSGEDKATLVEGTALAGALGPGEVSTSCGGTSGTSSSGRGVSANLSKQWGGAYRRGSLQFARSATVSVTAQKAGGDLIQPMGRDRRIASRVGSPGRVGKTIVNLGQEEAAARATR